MSQVIVRQFNQSQASELFGSATGILKGELWQKGGAPACGFGVFGGGGGFSKGKKLRSVELTILSMKVSYSNSSQLLSVNISVVNVDSDQGGFDSDY